MAETSNANQNKPAKQETVKAVYNNTVPSIFTHNGVDYALYKGESYDLPADCDHVQSLIGQNYLTTSKK